MYEKEIDRISLKHPDILIVETGTQGMYILYDDSRDSIGLTGMAGMVRLSVKQLRELLELLPDVLDLLHYRA